MSPLSSFRIGLIPCVPRPSINLFLKHLLIISITNLSKNYKELMLHANSTSLFTAELVKKRDPRNSPSTPLVCISDRLSPLQSTSPKDIAHFEIKTRPYRGLTRALSALCASTNLMHIASLRHRSVPILGQIRSDTRMRSILSLASRMSKPHPFSVQYHKIIANALAGVFG